MKKILFLLLICCSSMVAFGQRDTLIVHEKGDFKILENRFFDKNNDLIKQVFLTEGDIPMVYFSKEDLFLRGIKDDKATMYGIILDSVIIYDFNTITEKWYFRGSGDAVIQEKKWFIQPTYISEKRIYDFSRAFFTRSEINTFSNPTFQYAPPRSYYSKNNDYDSLFTYQLNGISIEEYQVYFPNGNIRQKMYKTKDYDEDSIIVFRFDGSLKEKLYPYTEPIENGEIKAKIIHKYDLNGTAIIEIDTIYQWFHAVFQKNNNSETTTFITEKNNKKLYSTIDTAFALGERDSLFIYQKHDLKILEGRFYYKNGQIKKRIFESEGDISAEYITPEDLFVRGIKPYEDVTLYARKLDSIIIYHNDGRINKKWAKDNLGQRYIFNYNQYYTPKATTSFNANELITKPVAASFVYSGLASNKQRIGENITIPFELISFVEELVTFEIISKDNIQFQNGQNVVNYGDTLRLDLEWKVTKNKNNYDFILRGTTADTTYNLKINFGIDGYHLTKSDFENGITYELTTNNLMLYFEHGGGKILKIYKNGVLEAEGSVPQIMNEISFKGYAKGEYTLELLDLTTRRKDKMTLILK